jgi:prepilin-type N-terminal cleavage/methylation domain-containing protein
MESTMKENIHSGPSPKPGGFTLLETVIALGLFSLVLLFSTSTLVTIIKTNALSQNRTGALALAQGKMETLKSQPASGLKGETELQVTNGNLPAIYRRETSISRGTPTGCALVTVRVSWSSETASKPHQVELATLIAE